MFSGLSTESNHQLTFPVTTPWVWDLTDLVPNGCKLDFERLKKMPEIFRPMLNAMWNILVNCVPPKAILTIDSHKYHLFRFQEYLLEEGRNRKLKDLSEITNKFLVDYRAVLFQKYSKRHAAALYGTIRSILQELKGKDIRPFKNIPDDLEIPIRRLEGKSAERRHKRMYSHAEIQNLEKFCRQQINATLDRINSGYIMLRKGVDPRTEKRVRGNGPAKLWRSPENVLWYVDNVLRQNKFNINCSGVHSFLEVMYWKKDLSIRPFSSRDHAVSMLYPFQRDLVSILMLLASKTGLNADSILHLKRDCIQGLSADGKKTQLEFTKGRGNRELVIRNFRHNGLLSPIGLIRMALKITQPLVDLVDDKEKFSIWLGLLPCRGSSAKVGGLKDQTFYSLVNGEKQNSYRQKTLFEEFSILDDDGELFKFSFDKIRKYSSSGEYVRSLGNVDEVSRFQLKHRGRDARTTSAVHYLINDSTKPIHQRTIRIVQDKLVEAAHFKIISDGLDESRGIEAIAKKHHESEEQIRKLFSGEQDMFVAQCKDFYNKPSGKPNTACTDPWTCFNCENAVWTSRILPRVIRFLTFVEQQRLLMDATDWDNKFGYPFLAITQGILPRFGNDVIQRAAELAKGEPFYVPPNLRNL